MDWENESYVRLYTRDTTTWRRMGWHGQSVLSALIRKVDRSGRLACEDMEPWEAVALHTGAPAEFAREGVAVLLKLGVAKVEPGNVLFLPSFVPAQTARKSARLRQRELRDRRDGSSRGVTEGHDSERVVTGRHDGSRASHRVTPSLAQPSSAQLSSAQLTNARARGFSDVPAPDDSDAPPGFAEPTPRERSRQLIADLQGMQVAWAAAADELVEAGTLSKAPALTHRHLSQAAEGAARASKARGISRDEAALAMARHALRTALERGKLDQVGFLLVTLDPWAPEGAQTPSRARPGRVEPAPGTTHEDFAGVSAEDVERQIAAIGRPL